VDDGKEEGGRLSASGLGAGHQVPPRHNDGDRSFLHRSRSLDTKITDTLEDGSNYHTETEDHQISENHTRLLTIFLAL